MCTITQSANYDANTVQFAWCCQPIPDIFNLERKLSKRRQYPKHLESVSCIKYWRRQYSKCLESIERIEYIESIECNNHIDRTNFSTGREFVSKHSWSFHVAEFVCNFHAGLEKYFEILFFLDRNLYTSF